jgi:hypothetical protein
MAKGNKAGLQFDRCGGFYDIVRSDCHIWIEVWVSPQIGCEADTSRDILHSIMSIERRCKTHKTYLEFLSPLLHQVVEKLYDRLGCLRSVGNVVVAKLAGTIKNKLSKLGRLYYADWL